MHYYHHFHIPLVVMGVKLKLLEEYHHFLPVALTDSGSIQKLVLVILPPEEMPDYGNYWQEIVNIFHQWKPNLLQIIFQNPEFKDLNLG